MKNSFFLFLFLFGLFCAGTVQAQSDNIGSIHWILSDSELTLSGTGEIPNSFFGNSSFELINKDNVKSVVITEGISGISDFVFVSNNITSITIPASVTDIDANAFRLCKGLNTILVNEANTDYYSEDGVLFNQDKTLVIFPEGKAGAYTVPDGVKIIGENAFWLCQKLTSVTIPQSVIAIELYAFTESSITSVTINGSSLISIGEAAFDSCTELTSINIPASVTNIGDFAFWECKQLSSITLPASVIQIGIGAFTGCEEMTSITVDAGNTVYSSADGVLFDNTKTTLIRFPEGKAGKYVIPEPVKIIENAAFYNCNHLTSVTIPASVTTIYNYAFANCNNLSLVVNLKPSPQPISNDVFSAIDLSACTLRVPDVGVYEGTPVWDKFGVFKPLDFRITLNMKEICLMTDATATLSATISGDEFSPNIIVWESSQPTVASVDKTGKVTALKAGFTEITASAYDSIALCTVTVLQPGKSSIGGTVDNAGSGNTRVNLYVKTDDPGLTKRGIIGGYVLLATTVPNGNGEYSFDDLPEGSYQIEVVYEDFDPEATEALELSADETLTDIDFIIDEEEGKVIVKADIPTGKGEIIDTGANVTVYPNPFTDMLHISVETWRAASLHVINTAGMIVHTQTITNPDETIQLGHLPAGMYFIRIGNGGMVKTVKAIKIQ